MRRRQPKRAENLLGVVDGSHLVSFVSKNLKKFEQDIKQVKGV